MKPDKIRGKSDASNGLYWWIVDERTWEECRYYARELAQKAGLNIKRTQSELTCQLLYGTCSRIKLLTLSSGLRKHET